MFTNEVIEAVYDKCSGKCRYCNKKLAFSNYGDPGAHGAWEIDHSRSKANGGTNHLNNLFPACVDCNQGKGSRNGKSYIQSLREQNLYQSTRKKQSWWDRLFN